jgi:hypothetical protein
VEELHRPAQRGLGRAYVTTAPARAHARPPSSCSRWTATSSHDPADVPRLIAAVRGGGRSRARLALRARRRHGQLGSREAPDLARRLDLHARPADAIHDATGGFKCFRRHVLESIDLDSIDAPATSSRSRRRIARCGRASGSSRCRSPSSTARRPVEDEPRDRARGVWKVPWLRLTALAGRL